MAKKAVKSIKTKNRSNIKSQVKSKVTKKDLKNSKKSLGSKQNKSSSKDLKNTRNAKVTKPLRASKAENKKINKSKTSKSIKKTESKPAKLVKKTSKKDKADAVDTIPKKEEKKEDNIPIITKDDEGNEIIDMSKIKNTAPILKSNEVMLKCVKVGSKLRVRIISPGYYSDANCQFPKDIRKEGRVYKVNVKEVVLAEGSAGRYFYRVKNGIQILDGSVLDESITKVKIFEDKSENDCAICLCSPKTTVIVPCGHFYTCKACSTKLDNCPICRGSIAKLIDKTSMD